MSSSDSVALSVDYIGITSDYLRRMGIDCDVLYKQAGISKAELASDGLLEWPVDRLTKWMYSVKDLSATPAIGVHLGQAYNMSAHGQLGQLALCSENILQILELVQKYTAIRNRLVSINVEKNADNVSIRFDTHIRNEELVEYVMEVAISTITSLLQFSFKNLSVSDQLMVIHFKHKAPDYLAEYERILQCPLLFEQDSYVVQLPLKVCEKSFRTSNQSVLYLIAQQCEAMLVQVSNEDVATRVRNILINRIGNIPTQDELAAELSMAPRTLRKHLKEGGTSFQQLLDDVRLSLARTCLKETDWTIEDIAAWLGYSDRSNFSSAFKKWHGSSPVDYRRSQQ